MNEQGLSRITTNLYRPVKNNDHPDFLPLIDWTELTNLYKKFIESGESSWWDSYDVSDQTYDVHFYSEESPIREHPQIIIYTCYDQSYKGSDYSGGLQTDCGTWYTLVVDDNELHEPVYYPDHKMKVNTHDDNEIENDCIS